MTVLLRPGQGILFMKVGKHAKESLEDIVARKRREIDEAGFALWGYGGNTCHPATMVRPFAEERAALGETITLCMEPMDSKHDAPPVRATEYSTDGVDWVKIPKAINSVGSRFALFLSDLSEVDFELPLSGTEVAIGPREGRSGHQYIQHRVDKACLTVRDEATILNDSKQDKIVKIRLTATLMAPYAAFLRGEV